MLRSFYSALVKKKILFHIFFFAKVYTPIALEHEIFIARQMY